MKLTKLNNKGFSHHAILAIFVVVFAIAGVAYLVASHANSIQCTSIPIKQGWGANSGSSKDAKWNCAGHIQYALNAVPKGKSTIHLKVDGQYGPGTAAAVRYAQRHYHITPYNGEVSPKTWDQLICPLLRGQVKRHHSAAHTHRDLAGCSKDGFAY
jgi:peptidoglycan hydrolase-like protein with peptidoglycan-binding domain